MASNNGNGKEYQSASELKRTWSTKSATPTCGGAHAAPKCVCAPATHAGSFKCRLHRTGGQSHGHSVSVPRGPTSTVGGSAPSASRTVEAQ